MFPIYSGLSNLIKPYQDMANLLSFSQELCKLQKNLMPLSRLCNPYKNLERSLRSPFMVLSNEAYKNEIKIKAILSRAVKRTPRWRPKRIVPIGYDHKG